MKNYISRILLLFIILLSISCNKDNTDDSDIIKDDRPTTLEIGDGLSESQLAYIDTMPSLDTNFDEYYLPNGRSIKEFMSKYDSIWFDAHYRSDPYANYTPFERKNILIGKFTTEARYLANRDNFQIPFGGNNKPSQYGLAYSYGSKNYTVRQQPPAGSCVEEVHGLDCSGYLYLVFKEAELDIPVGPAATQHLVSTIENALSVYPSLSELNVSNLGGVQPSLFQTGDIIYWSKLNNSSASHIGIVVKKANGDLAIFQSNGSSYSNCASNYGQGRGPRAISLSSNYWFGSGARWEVTRIEATSSTGGGQVNCSNFNYSCLQWGGNTGYDDGTGGTIVYPISYTIPEPCGGIPPYEYSVDLSSWHSVRNVTIPQPGSYYFFVKDSEGCYTYILQTFY